MSAEQILQAILLNNGNINHLNHKINAVWKNPGQRRLNNSTQLDIYIIQYIPEADLTLRIAPYILSLKSPKGRVEPTQTLEITPDIRMGTLKYLSKQTQPMRRGTQAPQKKAEVAEEAETSQDWSKTNSASKDKLRWRPA